MANLGDSTNNGTTNNQQAGPSFLIGNIYQAASSGTLVGNMVVRLTGSTAAGQDQVFRPVVYTGTPASNAIDGTWTLVSAGTQFTVPALAAVADYTATGLTGSITSGSYYGLILWSGPAAGSNNTWACPSFTTGIAGIGGTGTPGNYQAMTYHATNPPTSPWPFSGTHGVEDKTYRKLYVDYTPAAAGGPVGARLLLGVGD